MHRRRKGGGGGGGGGGKEGALVPPILGIMCIKDAEFILDTPFGPPPTYVSDVHGLSSITESLYSKDLPQILE